jgi:hypothetical protein
MNCRDCRFFNECRPGAVKVKTFVPPAYCPKKTSFPTSANKGNFSGSRGGLEPQKIGDLP